MSSLSSDSLSGVLFAYNALLDNACVGSQEREAVTDAVDAIVGGIVRANFTLLDIDGHATRWGVWNFQSLNNNQSWFEEKGLNSAMILAWLLLALKATGKPDYSDAFRYLAVDHGYLSNMINARITAADDTNFSDDQLAFLAFQVFSSSLTAPAVTEALTPSVAELARQALLSAVRRSIQIARPQRNALFASICASCGFTKEEEQRLCGMEDSWSWTLQRWPADLIDWPINSSFRTDIRKNTAANEDQSGHRLHDASTVLPPDERPLTRWNADNFQLAGGSGMVLQDPSAFLLPLWLAATLNEH